MEVWMVKGRGKVKEGEVVVTLEPTHPNRPLYIALL